MDSIPKSSAGDTSTFGLFAQDDMRRGSRRSIIVDKKRVKIFSTVTVAPSPENAILDTRKFFLTFHESTDKFTDEIASEKMNYEFWNELFSAVFGK